MSGGFGLGGGGSASGAGLSPLLLPALYQNTLPSTLGVTSAQIPKVSNTIANAANAVNPLYTQGTLNQLNNYAPGYQQSGADLATSQAQSTNSLLNGAGGDVARSASALSNSLNPVQANAQNQANNLLNSINLNGLSGGEQSAVERSLNQSNYATGNLGLDNATNAVNNAMNFGNALASKRAQLGSALGAASGVASNQNAFVNPVGNALNAGNVSGNFGLGQFAPTQGSNTVTAPLTFGQSMFGSQSGASNAPTQTSHNFNTSGGGGSCFLTTACCEYRGLPDDCEELMILRKFRDECVPKNLVEEYYRIAPAIVNKIQNDRVILQHVFETITECVVAIKYNKSDVALDKYINLVNELK